MSRLSSVQATSRAGMTSSQRFVIAAIFVLALVAAAAYGIGVWTLQFDKPATSSAAASPKAG